MPTRVKICGITRWEDVEFAAKFGADAIGFNFVAGPRRIDVQTATSMYWGLRDEDSSISRYIEIVALCTADANRIPGSLSWTDLRPLSTPDFYQVYAEDYEVTAASPLLFNRWWMVARIADRASIIDMAVKVAMLKTPPAALLLDTASEKLGGTGHHFNWNWIAEAREAGELNGLPPIILAGGLTPENVADAIRIACPYAVDVSSGVEVPGKPGIKDPLKMRDFIQAAKSAL